IVHSLSRRRTAFSLVLLEVASGFTTISCLVLASGWYHQLGSKPSGHDESDLVVVALHAPAAGGGGVAARRAAAQRHAEAMAGARALGRLVRADDAPPARVVAVVDDVVMRDPWNAHGACVSFRFAWSPDERETRYLVRARPGLRTAAMAGLRAALGPSGPARR